MESLFPYASLSFLHSLNSDHNLISLSLVQSSRGGVGMRNQTFHFEPFRDESCLEVVAEL